MRDIREVVAELLRYYSGPQIAAEVKERWDIEISATSIYRAGKGETIPNYYLGKALEIMLDELE